MYQNYLQSETQKQAKMMLVFIISAMYVLMSYWSNAYCSFHMLWLHKFI